MTSYGQLLSFFTVFQYYIQERSTRQQAAECPPKYEDVFDAPGGRGHAQAHNQPHGAHANGAHTHGQPFSTSYRR